MLVSRKPWGLPELPEPTHGGRSYTPFKTARNAIGDLESVKPRTPQNPGMTALPHKKVLVKHHSDTMKAFSKDDECLVADKPAMTILCSHEVRHYALNRNITDLERARLQEFPDYWKFSGGHVDIMKQIGNAVPVGTSAAIGRAIIKSCYEITDIDFFASSEEQTISASPPKSERNASRVTDSPGRLRAARNF
jgi:site-specific DNA-cytosine methylase